MEPTMQTAFGAGALWGNRTDVTGSGIGPDQFGILQDVTIDFSFETRELYGQYQFPVDIGRGKGKITGKAKVANIAAAVYGDLFFGSTPTTGMTTVAENETAPVPASPGPYTITVTNAADYVDDLGVYYSSGANAPNRFTRVTTPSSAGQYSVNLSTGVYTFAAADADAVVAISYIYTDATNGKTVTITNQLMGVTPLFKATFYTVKAIEGVSKDMALVLNRCTSSSLSFPTRNDDFEIPEFSFSAYADASGIVGTISSRD
jgi:hypothetical protein